IRARFDFPPPAKFRGVARAAIWTWHQYHPYSFAGNAPGSVTDRSRALFAHQATLRKARKTELSDQLGRPSARDQLRHRFPSHRAGFEAVGAPSYVDVKSLDWRDSHDR